MLFESTVAVLMFVLIERGCFSPVFEYDKGVRYEEYIIEHEISATQAKNAAIYYNAKVPPPGCQTCTTAEKRYCMGRDLINDHCCCDKRYHEELPYIPHTCYLGTQLCSTIASDCAEYSRLLACCCDKYVSQKWKQKSGGASRSSLSNRGTHSLILICNFVYIFVKNIFT